VSSPKMLGQLHHRNPRKLQCYVLDKDLTDTEISPSSPEMDQLFLLPDAVLGMDSLSFREDVAAVAPDFLSTHFKNSPPHNSLDSTDSNRSSVRVLEDTEGLVFARASNGCLWLCDANTLSPMENRHVIKSNETSPTKADLMTMSTPPHLLSVALEEDSRPQRRYYNHRNQTSDLWYTFGDGDEEEDTLALQKEREERVRKIREIQEEERKKKIEELKQHAIQQQKFREQQEVDRKKRMDELRARENDKFAQVEERRRAIESAERERREALLRKNQEREEKIVAKRKAQNSQTHFAFGSCTPRLAYAVTRTDSGSDMLNRSPSQLMSQSMYSTSKERRSAERDLPGNNGAKRATSAHGLDQDLDAEENYMSQSYHPGSSAHRRRTDLMPTITFNAASPASGLSRSSTPGTRMLRSPGKAVSMSRLDALSKPRNHISSSNNNKALHENQKQLSSSPTSAHPAKRQLGRVPKSNHSPPRKISQSMSHLGPRIKPKLEVAKGECSRTNDGGEGK